MELATRYSVVIAIDFGTSGSGYCYAFTAPPTKVIPNTEWPKAPSEGKTITEVLLNKNDHSFVAFGYEARNIFVAAANKDQYLYFSRFKMVLHTEKGAVRSSVTATNCKDSIDTKKLVSVCLAAIVKKAVTEEEIAKIPFDRIRWVLTVPAIWDEAAKNLMKEAAQLAGIENEHLIVAKEPEAAAIFCMKDDEESDLDGSDIMVVDAGGGTIDITVHRKGKENTLVERATPSGGNWGSSYINEKFEDMLKDLLGQAHILEKKQKADWYDMLDRFETVKINFNPDRPRANVDVAGIIAGMDKLSLTTGIERYNGAHNTTMVLAEGMLRIASVLPVFVASLIDRIAAHLSQLLSTPTMQQVKYCFLVGGFAESKMLQRRIQTDFGKRIRLVIPPRPGAAVMNGAVLYGLNPEVISARIMSHSIGVNVLTLWDEAVHQGKKKVEIGGVTYCDDTIHYLVPAKQLVQMNHIAKQELIPAALDQTVVKMSLYESPNSEKQFLSDDGLRLIGFLLLDIPNDPGVQRIDRIIDLKLKLGGTTFTAEATYRRTGHSTSARFKFALDTLPTTD